jgi:hypothetical protein
MLTKTDIERPRTQQELRAWVDDLHRKFGQTPEGKQAIRLNQGDFIKKFKEEIWPLALFADAFYKGSTDVLFKPVMGNQSYDALVLKRPSLEVLHYLQITQSFDGKQNYRRMLHLQEHGRAPQTSPELPKNPKAKHVDETWPEAVRHEDVLRQTLQRILEAVQRKSVMRYEPKTSLIVEFEDTYIQSAADRDALDQFARSELLSAASNFDTLYLVSDRERLALRYDSMIERPVSVEKGKTDKNG